MEKDLKYYKKLKYDVVVRKKGGKFIVLIPELSCIEADEDIAKAYDKLEASKVEYFKKMIELDSKDVINKPKMGIIKRNFAYESFLALLKFTMGFIIIALIFLPIAKEVLEKTPVMIVNKIDKEINGFIKKLANEPENVRENRIARLQKTLIRIKPYIDEFRIILGSSNNESTDNQKKK